MIKNNKKEKQTRQFSLLNGRSQQRDVLLNNLMSLKELQLIDEFQWFLWLNLLFPLLTQVLFFSEFGFFFNHGLHPLKSFKKAPSIVQQTHTRAPYCSNDHDNYFKRTLSTEERKEALQNSVQEAGYLCKGI